MITLKGMKKFPWIKVWIEPFWWFYKHQSFTEKLSKDLSENSWKPTRVAEEKTNVQGAFKLHSLLLAAHRKVKVMRSSLHKLFPPPHSTQQVHLLRNYS